MDCESVEDAEGPQFSKRPRGQHFQNPDFESFECFLLAVDA